MGWDVPWYSAQDSAEALLAGRWFGMQVCYLRDGDRVFETYWSTRPGRGGAGTQLRAARHDGVRPAGNLGGLSAGLAPAVRQDQGEQFRTNGRPTAQWSRLAAGRSDDLTGN